MLFTLPSIAATLVEPLVEIVDSAIIGPISPIHLSALSANGAIFAVSVWIFNFLVHVGSAEVASAYAAGNQRQLKEGILLSLTLPLIIGAVVSISLYFLRDLLLINVMGLGEKRLELGYDYFDVRLYSIPFALLLSSSCGVLRGLGKVNKAFLSVLIMTVLNIGLTLYFVKVLDLSLKGAALGSLISLAATAIPIALTLYAKHLKSEFLSTFKSLDLSYLRSYAANSSNQFLRTVAISSSFFISASVANSSGAITGASHQVVLHFWLFASYVLDGFSVTATTIGADLWFSEKRKEWLLLSKRLLVMSLVIGLVFAAVYLLFPSLVYLFTSSDEVYSQVMIVWVLISLFQIPNSILYTYDGLFFSQKNFKYIRKKIWQGFLFVFLPVLYFWGENNLLFIWIAVCGLNSYRFAAFSIKLKSIHAQIKAS